MYEKILLWKVGEDVETKSFKGHGSGSDVIDLSKDDKMLLTYAMSENVVRFWDVESGLEQSSLDLDRAGQTATFVKLSPDGKRVLFGGHEEFIRVWNVPPPTPTFRAPAGTAQVLAARPDGALFATAGLEPHFALAATDADVIKTYVALGLGVGIVAAVAYQAERDAPLVALDARHLFAANVTRVAVKRQGLLREVDYDFIRTFAPPLTREVVQAALRADATAAA